MREHDRRRRQRRLTIVLLLNPCTNVSAGPFSIAVEAPCALSCDQPLVRAVTETGVKDVAPFDVSDERDRFGHRRLRKLRQRIHTGVAVARSQRPRRCRDTEAVPLRAPPRSVGRSPRRGRSVQPGNRRSRRRARRQVQVALQRLTAGAACETQQLQCGGVARCGPRRSLDTDLLSFSVRIARLCRRQRQRARLPIPISRRSGVSSMHGDDPPAVPAPNSRAPSRSSPAIRCRHPAIPIASR